jgi:hypothetical protein
MSETVRKRLRIIVIGGLPEPSGGVTVFNGDLVEMLLDDGNDVVVFDQNIGKKHERFAEVEQHVWQGQPGLGFHLWVSRALLRLKADRIVLHTSNTGGLVRLIIPMLRGQPCVVFFHNGEVESSNTSGITRIVLRWLMRFLEHAFVMSQKQFATLTERGYPIERLSRITPIVRKPTVEIGDFKSLIDRPMVILACGHETRIYNYEFAVRVSQELPMFEFHLYLYGTFVDEAYLDELYAIDVHKKMRVFRNKDRNSFLHGLQNSRLFVRPNHVDSYGVSVVDSLLMGTPVVASNVCERAEGALLFAAGDYGAFRKTVSEALEIRALPLIRTDMVDDNIEIIRSKLLAH